MNRPGLLLVMMAVGVLSISTAAPLIKLCDDAAAVVIAAARLGIASCILLPGAALLRRSRPSRRATSDAGYILLAGACLSAHFVFWMTSLKHTSVLSSVVIVTANPIFVGVASYLLFKERPHRWLLLAIGLAVSGGLLIALSDARAASGGDSLFGDLMALCGAIMASCYLLVGRKVRRRVDTLSYITPVYAVAAVILVGLVFATGHDFFDYRRTTYVYFVLLALVPQLLGHTSFNWALRHMTATAVTVFILGEPIGASLIAYFVLDESVQTLQVAGSVLILTGILAASRSGTSR